jgi:hypothetical protein
VTSTSHNSGLRRLIVAAALAGIALPATSRAACRGVDSRPVRSVYFAHDSRTASVLRAHPRHGDLS